MRAVNLLPPDTRGASKGSAEIGAGPEAKGGVGAFVILGVLALCVAGVAGSVLAENTIKQRSVDLAQVTVSQKALQSQADALKPYADYDAMAKARIQTVRDLATSRFDWAQSLRDLARAVPQDITLLTLTGDISTAGGGSGVRGAIPAPAITVTGCAPGQTQVARLMARLRDIDGVTRVALSQSVATAITAAPQEGTERAQRIAAPCGAGEKPSFEVVMFFEGEAAAVASTPATATGAVAATPTPSATPTPTASPGTSSDAPATTPQGTTP